jgi:hypothetical protein
MSRHSEKGRAEVIHDFSSGTIVEMRNTKSGASARMASTRFWERFVNHYIFAGFMQCEIGHVDLADRSRPRLRDFAIRTPLTDSIDIDAIDADIVGSWLNRFNKFTWAQT